MAKTWILVAHLGGAKIYEAKGTQPELTLTREIDNSDARSKKEEFVDDQAGRVFNHFSTHRHTEEKKHDVHTQLLEQHANNLSQALRDGRTQNMYKHLVLVAEPKLLGQLRKSLDEPTLKLVSGSLDKDLSHATDKEVGEKVKELVQEAARQS